MTRFSRTPQKSQKARDLRNDATPAEGQLWTLLSGRKLGGYRFRRQHPVGPYVLDFFCAEASLAIELDGDQHGLDARIERDSVRDQLLRDQGIEVLRFWNHELGGTGVDVAEAILARLRERGDPSSKGRVIDPVMGRLTRTKPRESPRRAEKSASESGDRVGSPPGPPFSRGGRAPSPALIPPLEKGGLGGDPQHTPSLTPEAFAALASVPRETLERLQRYDSRLMEWSAHTNLVARSTLEDRWRRHFLDSAQLFPLIPPGARTLVDFGSGAGFPGLVLAAMGAPRLKVFLIESIGKKAAFLTEAAAAMGLDTVSVLPERIESLTLSPPDVITARALASLDKLCAYAFGLAGPTTRCLFLKGQDVENELTEATKSWRMEVTRHPSRTDPAASILEVRSLTPKTGRPPRKDPQNASAHTRHRQSKRGGRQDDHGHQSGDGPRRGRGKSAAR